MTEALALLQEMILAARAAGDADTAAWLLALADDPAEVARVTGAGARTEAEEDHDPLGRALLEHGFTGTITDTAGHKRTYSDGKQVANSPGAPDADAGGAGARTHPTEPTAEEKAQADAHHDALPEKEKGRLAKAGAAVEEKLKQTKGGRAVLALGKGGAHLFHALEHRFMYVAKKTQEVAAQAAVERGLPEEKLPALKRALYTADFLGGYGTGAVTLALTHSKTLTKLSMFLPSASVAYLAYSTARNPLATWRAAKKVVADTFAKGERTTHESEEGDPLRVGPELAGLLADRLRDAADPDWYLALFHAALAHADGDAERAIELTDAALAATPDGPAEDDD